MWELGQEYLRRAPLENDATLLEELITLGTEPITLDSAKSALIAEKVAEDFDSGKVVIIDGWILSITEARQCALFSIS